MMQISGIIITKNEEEIIADCIESLKFCDELIIIDNNSTDRTVEIAQRLNAKIISSDTKDFAELRTLGLNKAKGKWVLYIDADERVTDELRNAILDKIKEKKSNESAYFIKRKNFYFGNNEWPKVEEIKRLFKKSELEEWYGQIHESPKVRGSVGQLTGFLNHYTHRDLTYMVNKTNKWSEIESNLRLNANHPEMTWWRFPRVMVSAFWESYIVQKGYKLGTVGFIESMFQSYSMFITYAKLWEKQQLKK